MTFDEAKVVLNRYGWLRSNGTLYNTEPYVHWDCSEGDDTVTLDSSYFGSEDLMAIAVYVKEYKK
jgi:hypothetical protein